MGHEKTNMEGDLFAQYAQMADNSSKDDLVTPVPIAYEKKVCAMKQGKKKPCRPMKRSSTKSELYEELGRLRKAFEPFLADFAPQIEETRQKYPLKDFVQDGKKITIPHYDGPIGPAEKTYTTEFELPKFEGEAVYFCCQGADYIATVYVNGRCVGIHEGFFSPFEYDITRYAVEGKNHLEIVLQND